MLTAIIVIICVLLVVALTAVGSAIRVLREYERGVVFRLGRLVDLRGPGLVLMIPSIDRLVRISLRTVTLTVPPQEVITRDNIPVRVTAVTYYRVIDPNKAVIEIENYHAATLQIAQTTLRSVLGGADLDTLLGEREHLNEALQHVIDAQTEPWGIKVTAVEIKDVEIPERMQHAIARQAEAERERRAKVINAEGEAQAAAKLAEAANVIARNPVTVQLRYLQTLGEIGGQQNSTVVFPMPIDLIGPMVKALGGAGTAEAAGADTAQEAGGTDDGAPEADASAAAALEAEATAELEAHRREALGLGPGDGADDGTSAADAGARADRDTSAADAGARADRDTSAADAGGHADRDTSAADAGARERTDAESR